jgi:hypothetical protein
VGKGAIVVCLRNCPIVYLQGVKIATDNISNSNDSPYGNKISPTVRLIIAVCDKRISWLWEDHMGTGHLEHAGKHGRRQY